MSVTQSEPSAAELRAGPARQDSTPVPDGVARNIEDARYASGGGMGSGSSSRSFPVLPAAAEW